MNKINLALCGAVLLALTISCSMMKASKAVGPAVEKFHAQFNEKQFTTIYSESDDQLKKLATEQQLIELLEAVHRKMGTVQKSTAGTWKVNSGPIGSMVTATYTTEFSGGGKGDEQFVFSVNGDDVKLAGYHINSMDLITK